MLAPLRLPVTVALVVAGSLGAATALGAVPRRVFVTSVSGTGDLGSWPDAGTATGADAGDAICQARAAAVGIPAPGAFRAWIGGLDGDAYCRVHGLPGGRGDDCGLPGPPPPAGPWVRVDDRPFGAEIDQLLYPDGEIFLPAWLDENGDDVHGLVWTGTLPDGQMLAGSCNNWTSDSGSEQALVGRTGATAGSWTSSSERFCDIEAHLYCFQFGAGDPLPAFANWGRLAFVTSVDGSGELGSWPEAGGETGTAAGDAICRDRAAAAGLPHAQSFKAWLSDSGLAAPARFLHDGPWMRLDRVRVGADLADLTDTLLHSPINLTETGEYLMSELVWTGTSMFGSGSASCGDWVNPSATGLLGTSNAADLYWTQSATGPCTTEARLYCLQDLPLVFGDGFESGNTDTWTSVSP